MTVSEQVYCCTGQFEFSQGLGREGGDGIGRREDSLSSTLQSGLKSDQIGVFKIEDIGAEKQGA